MTSRSIPKLRTSYLLTLLVCGLPFVPMHAQGGIGILRRLPGIGDVITAAELMKNTEEIRKTTSPIAGTYRFVVHFDTMPSSDSMVVYARTFDKPTTAAVGGNFPSASRATAGQMIQGYVLTVVCAERIEDLPTQAIGESANDAAAGGGIALVYPFAGDTTATRAFAADWILLLPEVSSETSKVFNKRMKDARKGAVSSLDGKRKPRSVNNLSVEAATTILAADNSVRIAYSLVQQRAFASIRGERIAMTSIPRP